MKSLPRKFFHLAALAVFVSPPLTLFIHAQAAETAEKSAAPPPLVAPVGPEAPTAPVAPAVEAETPLRRIDQPVNERRDGDDRQRIVNDGDIPFGDRVVPFGSRKREAISIFGSTVVEGDVSSDVLSVFGHTTIGREAKVGGGAVAVFGRLDTKGNVRGDAVSVLGGSTIDGHVGGEAVAVLGDLHLGPNAVVDGDLVVVLGAVTREPGAIVHGNQVNLPIPFFQNGGNFEWFTAWFKQCLRWGRLLGFDEQVRWAWLVAGAFLAFYLLLALLFPRGIEKCAETLETRPGKSVLAAFLSVLLAPLAVLVLSLTVVLVPFLAAGMTFATLFGKAAMLAWLGRRFTKFFGDGPLGHPVFAVLLGGVIVTGLYTVPVLGVLTFKLLGWLGFGVVVYTLLLTAKREKSPVSPAPPRATPTAPAMPAGPAPAAVPATSAFSGTSPTVAMASSGFVGTTAPMTAEGPPPVAETPPQPPPTPEPKAVVPPMPVVAPAISAATAPRADFMIRFLAMMLDVLLVGAVTVLSGEWVFFPLSFPGFLPVLAAYAAVMWKLKGTTIGGIVCGLKVVRLDGREIDWATATVRALGCFLSLVVVGLGFIWVAIDDEKQSWHDKIAGTTVVRLPKGVSLV